MEPSRVKVRRERVSQSSLVRLSVCAYLWMQQLPDCELQLSSCFSRASSDLKLLPTERLPTRLADECERAAAKAPRRSVEDRGHEFLCTARGRWPPRREVGGGRSGVCGQRRPGRSHDRGPRRDGGEKGSARFFWALQGCSTELAALQRSKDPCHLPRSYACGSQARSDP